MKKLILLSMFAFIGSTAMAQSAQAQMRVRNGCGAEAANQACEKAKAEAKEIGITFDCMGSKDYSVVRQDEGGLFYLIQLYQSVAQKDGYGMSDETRDYKVYMNPEDPQCIPRNIVRVAQ